MASGKVRRRRVLVVDPDPVYRAGLEELLGTLFWKPISCGEPDSALQLLGGGFDAIWTEWDLHGAGERTEALLERARRADAKATLVIVTGLENVERAKLVAGRVAAVIFSKRDTQLAAIRLTEMDEARRSLERSHG